MSSSSYDLIVVGGGPAGLSAAAEAARAGLSTLCLDKLAPGGVLINLGALHDFEGGVDGPTLSARLSDEAGNAGVELGFGEVTSISGSGPWKIGTADGASYGARAVAIATGLNKGKLGLANETEFEGRGLSHCAICDGPLYSGEPVVVAGVGGWADVEARELAGMVGHVTVVNPATERIVGLEGANGLDAVVVESGGTRKSIPAKALFVYQNETPAAEFLPDSLARDASGHIVVDAEGRTSVPTVFAIGDVRSGAHRHLSEAIADGERAGKAIVAALKQVS
jgi:thioredoxin reductase (NADPH)